MKKMNALKKNYKILFLLGNFLVFNSLFFSISSNARWGTYKDAPTEIEFLNQNIRVHKNNTSEETLEIQIKILNEAGRSDLGNVRLSYNDNIQKIEIIEAKTIYNGKDYIVPKDKIEIKPLASDNSGFDQMNQVTIVFPNVLIGSSLYLKYKETTLNQALDNYFYTKIDYAGKDYVKSANSKILSEIPINISVNDPYGKLKIVQNKQDNLYSLEVKLKDHIYEETIDEIFTNLSSDKKTWVQVSTINDFSTINDDFAKSYEEIINQPLPPLFEHIRKQAINEKNDYDQINMVTSMISSNIRYMGDWRSINGRFKPHSLQEIEKHALGDCKDFSVSTAAILKKLGYDVWPSLIHRGVEYRKSKKDLISLDLFNHVMLKLSKNNKIYWIDPTNFVSMADGIFPDISNRYTLVLNSKKYSYEMTPDIDYKNSGFALDNVITINKDGSLKNIGNIKISGEEAIDLTGSMLNISIESLEEQILRSISHGNTELKSKKIILPDLSSRIVKDIEIKYEYEKENGTIFTNLGNALSLETRLFSQFLDVVYDQEGDTIISGPSSSFGPSSSSKKSFIKNVYASNIKNMNYDFNNKWIKANRICTQKNDGIEILENIEILTNIITSNDAKTKEFKNLQNDIKKYCTNVAILVESI